jgi:hypothetical protein
LSIVGEAFVEIKPSTSPAEFGRALEQQLRVPLDAAGKNLGDRFSGALGSGLKALGGLAVFSRIRSFTQDSIKVAQRAEQTQLKLNSAYERFPALGNVSIETLRNLGKELSGVTRFSSGAASNAAALLAQFKLTGTQVTALIPGVADLAARLGTDLPDAAQRVGLALLGNTRGLKQVGIEFKATGDRAADTARLIELLRAQVGGFAEKEGKTAAGQAAVLGNEFTRVQKKIGEALAPAKAALTSLGIEAAQALQKVPAPLLAIGASGAGLVSLGVSAGNAVEAFRQLGGGIGDVLKFLRPAQAAATGLAAAESAQAVAAGAAGAATLQLGLFELEETGIATASSAAHRGLAASLLGSGLALGAIALGTGAAIAGVAALAGHLAKVKINSDQLQAGLVQLGQGQRVNAATVDFLGDHYQKLLKALNDLGAPSISVVHRKAVNELDALDKSLTALVTSGHADQAKVSLEAIQSSIEPAAFKELVRQLGDYRDALASADGKAQLLASTQVDLAASTFSFSDTLGAAFDNFISANQASISFADSQDRLRDALDGGAASGEKAADVARRVADASRGVADARQREADAQERLNEVLARDPTRDLVRAELDQREATVSLARARQTLVDAEQKLADLRAGRSEGVTRAEEALAKAQRESAQGTIGKTVAVRKAETDLAKARADLAGDTIDAELSVAEAKDAVTEAELRQVDSGEKLAEVRSGKLRAKEVADAERDLRDAHEDVTDAEGRLREAHDKTAGAAGRLRDRQREVNGAIQDSVAALKKQVEEQLVAEGQTENSRRRYALLRQGLEELRDTFPGLNTRFDEFIQRLAIAFAQAGFSPVAIQQGEVFHFPGGATFRQHGGPLSRGQAAVVGEAGRELFVPSSSGTVIPHGQTERFLASAGPLVGTLHVVAPETSARSIVDVVFARLRAEQFFAGV